MSDVSEVGAVLAEERERLMGRANVVATGIGFKEVAGELTGEVGIVCSVVRKMPRAALAPSDVVPRAIAGITTDVVETGAFRALSAHRDRHRPAPGGVSIGHRDITAGTLGCIVTRGDERLILSNNHVIADTNLAEPGDPVLQPGPYDGGRYPDDAIAVLERLVPIRMLEDASGCGIARALTSALNSAARAFGSATRVRAVTTRVAENLVDAALALPLADDMVADDILGIGAVQGHAAATLGMPVRKSGRTTGVTMGRIVQVQVTADVRMGARSARFSDQLMAGAMSQGGDSGSLVLDDSARAVGLLFAGSDTTTLCNRIEHVLDALEVTL